jgi:IclR family transcriptional regulator, KDG regulon repressor
MNEAYHSSTIQKALNILNLFREHPELSLNDIQNLLGGTKTTLYRVLSTLLDNKYLQKNGRGKYRLGIKVFILGNRVSREDHLINVSTPFMKEFSQAVGLTALLGILDGTDIIIIQKTEPDRLMKMVCHIGGSVPAHCTSQGKVLLAYSSREILQKIVDGRGLQRFTPQTICTTQALLKELEAVRTRGYAIDDAEHEKDIRCVAVPIFDDSGHIEAALSSTGTIMDLPDGKAIRKMASKLKEAGEKIRSEMGYSGS